MSVEYWSTAVKLYKAFLSIRFFFFFQDNEIFALTRTFFCKTKLAWYREKYSLPRSSLFLSFRSYFNVYHRFRNHTCRHSSSIDRSSFYLEMEILWWYPWHRRAKLFRMQLTEPRLKSPCKKLQYNFVTNLLEEREKERERNIFKKQPRLPTSSTLFHSHLSSRRRGEGMGRCLSNLAWSVERR